MTIDIDRLKSLAISENGFMFDTISGQTFTLNSVGYELMQLLQSGKTEAELRDYLLENYEVSEDEVERDVSFFTVQLREYGILVEL